MTFINSIELSPTPGFPVTISNTTKNEAYLTVSFSGTPEEIQMRASRAWEIEDFSGCDYLGEILKTAKKIFPDHVHLLFDGSKTPFALLRFIAKDPRMEEASGTSHIKCDLTKIDENGNLIEEETTNT